MLWRICVDEARLDAYFALVKKRLLLVVCCAAIAACSEDSDEPVVAPDAAPDVPEVAAPDDGPPPADPLAPVATDLTEYDSLQAGAWVRKIDDAADLMDGEAVSGRVGDWLLGNDTARFIVQGPDRHSSPCPWGGNLIDASLVGENGSTHDVMGEACSFIQLGRTLLAERYDVISDGSEGPAILAVTGMSTLNDFLNLKSLVQSFIGNLASQLSFDPDAEVQLKITIYYVLGADSNAIRVVTAVQNLGADNVIVLLGDLVDSGGAVEFFNPASSLKGFGYKGYNPESIDYLAFVGKTGSYAVVPDTGGGYLAISGVAGIAYGIEDVLTSLVRPAEELAELPTVFDLKQDEIGVLGKWVVVGDGSLTSVTNTINTLRGAETGTLEITLLDTAGFAVPDHRVSFVQDGVAYSQARTDKDGKATAQLTAGVWDVAVDPSSRRVLVDAKGVTIATGKTESLELSVEAQASIVVAVADPAGQSIPAKVSVRCAADCPPGPTALNKDVDFDGPPGGVVATRFLGVDGAATIDVPSGDYTIVISRGPAWSVWPDNSLLGKPVSAAAGDSVNVSAVIEKVIDTTGWVNGDLHVHAINSPDSPVPNGRRVRAMMSEGVDVLVSTDHDFITDFAPTVAALGAEHEISTVVGEELTTFDYGHFNAFPLEHDADDLTGGARDWSNGEDDGWHPSKIFEALLADEGEQVVQVNHPENGYFRFVKWDANTDATYADPAGFRIAGAVGDEATGDTGLWSADFTAVEIMNGLSKTRFLETSSYWFTLLSRGLRRTGTAVSDTHKAIRSMSGGARTWARVGEDFDTPATFSAQEFAKAINEGRATGGTGPFVEVTAASGSQTAQIGDTLVIPAPGPVTFTAQVQVARWMAFDSVQLVSNVTDQAPEPGETGEASFDPVAEETVTLTGDDLVDGKAYKRVVTFELEVAEDGWYIVLVEGSDAVPAMYPVYPSTGARPFAFTNPIYIDVGGDGWTPPQPTAAPDPADAESAREAESLPMRRMTRAEAQQLLHEIKETRGCSH